MENETTKCETDNCETCNEQAMNFFMEYFCRWLPICKKHYTMPISEDIEHLMLTAFTAGASIGLILAQTDISLRQRAATRCLDEMHLTLEEIKDEL
jgi:hypothetical protein